MRELSKWTPVRKIVATALGAVTSTGVIDILNAVGITVAPTLATAIVGVVATLAGYLTPATAPAE